MNLKRLHLQNFKSFETAKVDFCPRLNVIIGENGTGKTNIIKGILKVAGPNYPTANSLQPSDFFQFDESKSIGIWLIFQDGAVERSLSFSEEGGRYNLMYDGNRASSQQREALSPLHIPPERTIPELPASNRWNPLGRIIAEIGKVVEADATVMQAYETKVEELQEVLEQSAEFRGFKERFKAYASEQIGARGDTLAVELGLMDARKVLRTLQVFEHVGGEHYNVSEGGQGIQSNLTIAALRAYAHVLGGHIFVVVDEPEVYLHPLAQRAMADLFQAIAADGTQVIMSTHSPHFVPREPTALTRVSQREGKSVITQFDLAALKAKRTARGAPALSDKALLVHLSHRMTIEVREGLFARTVVLCEGESEAQSLALWSKQCGHDFAKLGIGVVPAGGKFSILDLAEFYAVMGVPVFLVFDSDTSISQAEKTANRNLLAFAGTDPRDLPPTETGTAHAVFSPDYETVMRHADIRYGELESEVDADLGLRPNKSKGIRARTVAEAYDSKAVPVPAPISAVVAAIVSFHSTSHTPLPPADATYPQGTTPAT